MTFRDTRLATRAVQSRLDTRDQGQRVNDIMTGKSEPAGSRPGRQILRGTPGSIFGDKR